MAWFCCYDFDMVSVMILIWFQLWFLMWVKLVIWSQPIGTISKIFQNRIKTISKSYQNRIKIVSKSYPYQNHKNLLDKSTKNLSLGCFCFFFEANSLEPYQNRIKIISKSYQNRIKIVSKPYQNHIEIITPNSKHIKFISSNRIQNHIKIVKQNLEFSILEGFRSHNLRALLPSLETENPVKNLSPCETVDQTAHIVFLKNKFNQLYCVCFALRWSLRCWWIKPRPLQVWNLDAWNLENPGNLEREKCGNLEIWKVWTGTLEYLELPSHLQPCPGNQRWNLGTQNFGTLPDIAALEPRRACCWVAKLG